MPVDGKVLAMLLLAAGAGARARAEPRPPAPPPSQLQQWLQNPPPLSGGSARAMVVAGVTLGSLGLAAGVVGVALVVSAQSTVESFRHPVGDTRYDPAAVDRAHALQGAGVPLLIAGSVLLATGVVVGAIGASRRTAAPRRLALAPLVLEF